MSTAYPSPHDDAPLVVFDFDYTLYDGDSGSGLITWLICQNPLRMLVALLFTPILGPMMVSLPFRRRGVSGYVWIATFGLHRAAELDRRIDAYVLMRAAKIRPRLLFRALDVFARHRAAGDRVVVATGAPPELVRAILSFVAHQDVPVVGSLLGRRWGAVTAARHCHGEEKVRMLREHGYDEIAVAYSDSSADLPLLRAARMPVVVNPRRGRQELFRRLLPEGTPILNWGCPKRGGEPRDGNVR